MLNPDELVKSLKSDVKVKSSKLRRTHILRNEADSSYVAIMKDAVQRRDIGLVAVKIHQSCHSGSSLK